MNPNRDVLRGEEVEIFKIVSEGATPKQWARWLRAPLEHAAASGDLDLLKKLLKAGADGKAGWRGCRGRTLLDAAALGGKAGVMSALLQAGCGPDVNVVASSTGRSALYQSIVGKHAAAARKLIMAGADVNFVDRADKAGPLCAAVVAGYDDVVGDLLLAGANPNVRQSDCHGTPLHVAAEQGLANTVSVLLSSPSTNKDALDNEGYSPLMIASHRGNVATVNVLLAAGADVGIRDPVDDASALALAAQFGRAGTMKALLEHGVDANDGGEGRMSSLHWAALCNSARCIALLLDGGADINARSLGNDGQTAFHFAAKAGRNKALLALLRRGASVDQTTDDGSTALHLASEMDGDDVDETVDILLRWGASEQAVDGNGKTPVDLFKEFALKEDQQCPDEEFPELERALELLARAPADRTWRRRCWLVMLRERTKKERRVHGGRRRKGKKVGSGQRVLLGDGERGGSSKVRRGGRGRGRGGARAAVKVDLHDLVNTLAGLEPEAVFRTIVGYI
ncbi:unnamed protein product [Ectocarpus fasciculatus]